MNAAQFHEDMASGCLEEVISARSTYTDGATGSTVRQSFYVYPNDAVVSCWASDGGYRVEALSGHDLATFRSLHPSYF